jgi:flavin reductase (DIM6/NTAB) family NADH-FMN oxidoreductase RutF
LKSSYVAPYGIEECITNIECKVEWMKEAGDHDVVVGRVVNVRVSERLADRGIEGNYPEAVIHIGGGRNQYASIGDILE